MTSSQIPTHSAKQKGKLRGSHRFPFFANRTVRFKLVVSLIFLSVLISILSYAGMQYAVNTMLNDALPSLQALAAVNARARAVQAEALSFVSASDAAELTELDENIEQLNEAINALLELDDDADEQVVFTECAASAQKIASLSQAIVQSHAHTLETVEVFGEQKENAEIVFSDISTEVDREIARNIENEALDALHTVSIPAKNLLTEFISNTDELFTSALGYIVSGDPKALASFEAAENNLETAQESLADILAANGAGGNEIIQDLDSAEEQIETTGREIISSHTNTLTLLDEIEDAEAEFQTKIDASREKVNRDVNQGIFLTKMGAFATVLIVTVLSIIFGLIITRIIMAPIAHLTDVTQQLEAGNLSVQAHIETGDEFESLARAFNTMTANLEKTLHNLQMQTRVLETSNEISRRLSSILDLSQLTDEVVEQLQTAFNYYHVHIYLFDETKQTLMMVGGTGDAGRVMLARGHTIEKGRGLVGRAAETNEIVLAPDVAQEEGWLPNPLLPNTKSEVAVPIAIGSEVLGVLDVQQDTVGGITEQDAKLIQTIASQVAIAIQNAQIYTHVQRQAEHEARVASISQRIQSATSIDEVLQIAITTLGQTLKTDHAAIELKIDAQSEGGQPSRR